MYQLSAYMKCGERTDKGNFDSFHMCCVCSKENQSVTLRPVSAIKGRMKWTGKWGQKVAYGYCDLPLICEN